MKVIQEACRVLCDADVALRALIRNALQDKKYADVAVVASMADQLSTILAKHSAHAPIEREMATASKSQKSPSRPRAVGALPRFERDGDRLIKIGWSKKHGQVYEHKAPFLVAQRLLEKIRLRKGEEVLFNALDVLPLTLDDANNRVPDYQTYLALAWMRYEGIAVKHGRDGYILKSGAPTVEELEDLFQRLPNYRQNSVREVPK